MSDLLWSVDQLAVWSGTLRLIVRDLHAAGQQADDAALAVGHRGLQGAVHHFADHWRIHRGRTIDELTGMADGLDAVCETFTDLDSQIAAELADANGKAAAPVKRAWIGSPAMPMPSGGGRGRAAQ